MVHRDSLWNPVHKMNFFLQISIVCLALTVPFCKSLPVPNYENSVMEKIFKKYDNLSAISICEIAVEQISNAGDSYVSEYYKVTLNGLRGEDLCGTWGHNTSWSFDYTRSFISRVPNENQLDRHLFEVYVYEHALPELRKHLPPNTIFEVPQVIYTAPRMIFMENWINMGYTLFNRRDPYLPETLEASIKELAKLHSASIIMKQNDPGMFNYITDNLRDHLMNPLKKQKIFQIFNEAMQMANFKNKSILASAPPIEEALIKKIFNLDPVETFNKATAAIKNVPEELEVIINGELWQNNVVFNKTIPGNIKLIEMASLCKSNLVRDLIYIFATSAMNMEDRPKVVGIYLQNLKLYLKQSHVNASTLEKYTVELLMNEISRLKYFELVIAFIYAMPSHFTTVPSEKDIEGMSNEETLSYLSNFLGHGYDRKVRYFISSFYYNELTKL